MRDNLNIQSEIFKLLNNEYPEFKRKINISDYVTPTISSSTIRINRRANSNLLYFKLNTGISGNVKIDVIGSSTNTYKVYDIYGEEITNLSSGYYDTLICEEYFVILNRDGLSESTLANYNLIEEVLDNIINNNETIIDDGKFIGILKDSITEDKLSPGLRKKLTNNVITVNDKRPNNQGNVDLSIDDINDLTTNKSLNQILEDMDYNLEQTEINLNNKISDIGIITPKRLPLETSDSPAIQRAISTLSPTGGIIQWRGTLEIVSPITITTDRIQFRGVGEFSKIKVMAEMQYAITTNFYSLYGTRGMNWQDFYLDCNHLAKDGIVLGQRNPVVGCTFSNIKIYNSIEYGLVLDGTQNSLFNMIDTEYCGGSVKLLNGAGNNVFMKCEFNADNGLHQIYMDSDPNYPGYVNNIFNNTPMNNNFFNCVTERGNKLTCICITKGKSNSFFAHEFESSGVTDCVIRFGTGAQLNRVSGRIAHGTANTVVPVINNGYTNYLENLYIENHRVEYFAQTNNVLIVNDVKGDSTIRIENLSGDIGNNVQSGIARYVTSDPFNVESLPAQFLYTQSGLFFKGRYSISQLQSGRQFNGTLRGPSGTTHNLPLTLQAEGTWLIDVIAKSDDSNHSISNTFNARYKNNGTYDVKNIQKTIEDVTSGTVISNLSAIIDEFGNVTVSVNSSSSLNVTFAYTCRQLNTF